MRKKQVPKPHKEVIVEGAVSSDVCAEQPHEGLQGVVYFPSFFGTEVLIILVKQGC
jgi:hypothetical protein